VIRLRWPNDHIDPADAVGLAHPRLVRLRGAGSWSFAGIGGMCVATLALPGWEAAGWEDWQPGTDGCEYSLATNPPGLDALSPRVIPVDAELIDLACGERVWVLPARLAARRLGFDGRDLGPGSAYGIAAHALSARMDAKTETCDDIMRVALMAAASVTRVLLPEVCIGYGLVTSADLRVLLEAAWRVPKAQPGAGSSSSAPTVSTATT
jgi:hypothetical protein